MQLRGPKCCQAKYKHENFLPTVRESPEQFENVSPKQHHSFGTTPNHDFQNLKLRNHTLTYERTNQNNFYMRPLRKT